MLILMMQDKTQLQGGMHHVTSRGEGTLIK
jgi:hypothetical protein